MDAGATAQFTVTPNSGYQIASVTGCGGNLSGTTYTTGAITGNCTVSATFTTRPTYSLTLNTTGTGSGTVSGGGSYEAGITVNLTATPDAGSTFAGWSPTPCEASFPMPAQNLTCTATFTRAYTVTATAGAGGSITPPTETVDAGANCHAEQWLSDCLGHRVRWQPERHDLYDRADHRQLHRQRQLRRDYCDRDSGWTTHCSGGNTV